MTPKRLASISAYKHQLHARGICARCMAAAPGGHWKCFACRLKQAEDQQRLRERRAREAMTAA